MIDLGQYDAMRSSPTPAADQQGVFNRFRERLEIIKREEDERLAMARYLFTYLEEERARGVRRADEWTIADAIEAWQGGAR